MVCRAVSCPAVRCGAAVPWCAVVGRAVCYTSLTLSCMPGIIRSIMAGTRYRTPGLFVLHRWIVKNALPARLSSAVAQQRSATPCGAVRGALCRAASGCAVLSFADTVPGIMCSTRYQVPVCTCLLVLFSRLTVLPRPRLPPPPANYTRTADQNVTSPSSTQHSTKAISCAHSTLGLIKPLKLNQIMGLFFLPPSGPRSTKSTENRNSFFFLIS